MDFGEFLLAAIFIFVIGFMASCTHREMQIRADCKLTGSHVFTGGDVMDCKPRTKEAK